MPIGRIDEGAIRDRCHGESTCDYCGTAVLPMFSTLVGECNKAEKSPRLGFDKVKLQRRRSGTRKRDIRCFPEAAQDILTVRPGNYQQLAEHGSTQADAAPSRSTFATYDSDKVGAGGICGRYDTEEVTCRRLDERVERQTGFRIRVWRRRLGCGERGKCAGQEEGETHDECWPLEETETVHVFFCS